MVAHVLRALLPPPPNGPTVDFRGAAGQLLAEVSPLMWLGLVGSSLGFVLSPVTTIGWPLPSFWLPAEALDRHADRFSHHPVYLLRAGSTLLKMCAAFAWGELPAVRQGWGVSTDVADPRTWRP